MIMQLALSSLCFKMDFVCITALSKVVGTVCSLVSSSSSSTKLKCLTRTKLPRFDSSAQRTFVCRWTLSWLFSAAWHLPFIAAARLDFTGVHRLHLVRADDCSATPLCSQSSVIFNSDDSALHWRKSRFFK